MLTTQQIIDKTNELGAHNYHPKDVVIVDAHGVVVTDPEGREYYDMLSAYGQGVCVNAKRALLRRAAGKLPVVHWE